jgi:hypothetical protein
MKKYVCFIMGRFRAVKLVPAWRGGWKDGWGWMDGWMDGDGWMDDGWM